MYNVYHHKEYVSVKRFFTLLLLFSFSINSCKKFVEPNPSTTDVNQSNVFTNEETAIGALTGIFYSLNGDVYTGRNSLTMYSGLASDELTLHNAVTSIRHNAYYHNSLTGTQVSNIGSEFWTLPYKHIFYCNAAIEGLNKSAALPSTTKQQLMGEAKFVRAFLYFYLVNLFGDIPLALTTNYEQNRLLNRTPKEQVYIQLITDLREAQQLLSATYLDGTLKPYADRLRPTKWAATALLSRVYLYNKEWAKAEEEASTLISNSTLFGMPSLNNAFLKGSNEAIWQLQPVTSQNRNTEEGFCFVLTASGPSSGDNPVRPAYLGSRFLNSFEANDQRRVSGNWINTRTIGTTTYYYPFKYKQGSPSTPGVEYLVVLRLGEQYLIRAEARAHQNNIGGAQADLNVIRSRAGLVPTVAGDKGSLLHAILIERQHELFTEFGHRWLDLKRTGNIDAVMTIETPLKTNGSTWKSYQQWFPIPWSDIDKDPNLVQNPGY